MTIDDFWILFATNAATLATKPVKEIVNSLHALVVAHDKRLGVEVCIDEPVREVVITANGDVDAFQSARNLVAHAPQLAGWSFRALKPPQGFQFATEHDGVSIDARELYFEPLMSAKLPAKLGIRVFVPQEVIDKAQTGYIVNVILDTGLGEELASAISFRTTSALPKDRSKLLRIEQLSDYIEWHHRKYAS